MHTSKIVEIWVGIFVALGFAALFMLSMKVSNLTNFYEDQGYRVSANFRNVGSLKVKAPVTMAGVRVGRVIGIEFDQINYQAKVTLKIEKRYDKIPQDTVASIFTAGMLGEQYVGLEIGGDDLYLAEGSAFTLTQSAIVLENLIGQFLYSKAESGNK